MLDERTLMLIGALALVLLTSGTPWLLAWVEDRSCRGGRQLVPRERGR